MDKKATYAIFGGSFDPPHLGHREIIERALEVVDKIIVVPTYLNPFKKSFNISANIRYQWVKKIFSSNRVVVSDYEIKQNRAVYTYETLKELSKRYNIKAIIIGADNLKNIDKWYNFDYLNSNYCWIVATRANRELKLDILRDYRIIKVEKNVSSTEIRDGKKLEFIDKNIKKQVILEYNLDKKGDK